MPEQKQAERNYKDRKEAGVWKEWDENGNFVETKTYRMVTSLNR